MNQAVKIIHLTCWTGQCTFWMRSTETGYFRRGMLLHSALAEWKQVEEDSSCRAQENGKK